jgi:hypothetical protein
MSDPLRAREAIHTRRQTRPANLGDRTSVQGGQGLVSILKAQMGAESEMASLCVTSALQVPSGLLGTADYRPMVRVVWGNGGTTIQTDFDVTYRRSVPFATSILYAKAWICALPFPGTNIPVGPGLLDGPSTKPGTPPPGVTVAQFNTVQAEFSAFFATGQQLDDEPNFWLTQNNTNQGQFVVGACRVLQSRFYATNLAGAAPAYLQFFDTAAAPVNGDVAFDAVPIAVNTPAEEVWSDSRGFLQGFAWGISSTPYAYTEVNAAAAFHTVNIRM